MAQGNQLMGSASSPQVSDEPVHPQETSLLKDQNKYMTLLTEKVSAYASHVNSLYTSDFEKMKIQMKCCIVRHFIRVYTICVDKIDLRKKKRWLIRKLYITCDPRLDHRKFICQTRRKKKTP